MNRNKALACIAGGGIGAAIWLGNAQVLAVWVLVIFINLGISLGIKWANRTAETERILEQSDADALRSDWQAVGDDIRRAQEAYEERLKSIRDARR